MPDTDVPVVPDGDDLSGLPALLDEFLRSRGLPDA